MLWNPKARKVIKVLWYIMSVILVLGMVLMYMPIFR